MPNWDWEKIATLINTVLLIALTIAYADEKKKSSKGASTSWFLWVVVAMVGVFVVAQTINISTSSRHRIYGPELALRFEDTYDGERMVEMRKAAAAALNEYLNQTNRVDLTKTYELDYVLDFFEDLGFYWQNQEISDAVLHHHFYTAMRTYCQGAEAYIRDTEKAEPATWDSVLPLFQRLTEIEAKKARCSVEKCKWDSDTLTSYLRDEMALKAAGK